MVKIKMAGHAKVGEKVEQLQHCKWEYDMENSLEVSHKVKHTLTYIL